MSSAGMNTPSQCMSHTRYLVRLGTCLAGDVTVSHTLELCELVRKRFVRVDRVANVAVLLGIPEYSTLGLCRVRSWSSWEFVGLGVAVEYGKWLVPVVLLRAKVLLWLELGLGLEVHS